MKKGLEEGAYPHKKLKRTTKRILQEAEAYDIPLNMEKLVKVYSEGAELLQINETQHFSELS